VTIAVGAKYPWGDLNKLIPAGYKIPDSVILASDSRFSVRSSGGFATASDIGTKLFKLTEDAAAVYAGMSRVGETCLNNLRWELRRQNNSSSARSRKIAQKIFRTVYRQQITSMKLKAEDAPLYVLVGACGKHGQAELYLFSYANNFEPEPLAGLKTLAWRDTANAFKILLDKELDVAIKNIQNQRANSRQIPMELLDPMPITADHVAIFIGASLNRIIQYGSDKTIGGLIQCAIITTRGVSPLQIAYTTDPSNAGTAWMKITAEPSELKTVTGISGIFGLYNLSD